MTGIIPNSDLKPNYIAERAGDIKHSNADISKGKRLVGFDPQYSFEQGIAETIEWYKANL